MKKFKFVFIVGFILVIIIFSYISVKLYCYENKIKNLYINSDDKIVIEFIDNNKTFCYIGDKIENNWVINNNTQCLLDYTSNNKYIFLKNRYGKVNKIKNTYNLSNVKEFNIKNNKIYLAVNGKEKIDYSLDLIDDADYKINFISSNESIATVDNNGVITGLSVGETNIIVSLENYKISVNVIVTDTIIVPTNDYNYKKDYIKCNEFSKADNDLIDGILANRISRVEKNTRAAVVESARFMTMEFSKRIPYFAENGRLTINGVDGEGRYYREGMFLNDSRYKTIEHSMHGPAAWGCKIYSYPVNRTIPNGLDCSGFVSWAFINAGFDVGDIGAGITPVKDFTDLGIKKNIKSSIANKEIIVGDLLSGKFSSGGHIAIVIGIKDGNYYIAESLYEDNHTYYGVISRKYSFNDLSNYFSWHIDMSNFYEKNGNLTNYWAN